MTTTPTGDGMSEQLPLGVEMEDTGADFSPCRLYRYRLWRRWGPEPWAGWIMCNPSTADASQDDPTIRKCIGFAKRWGCGGIIVINICALRSTDARKLLCADDPVGPDNAAEFTRLQQNVSVIVAGWGNALPKRFHHYADQALAWMDGATVMCLGRTKGGRPRHPLMLSYDTPMERFAIGGGDHE